MTYSQCGVSQNIATERRGCVLSIERELYVPLTLRGGDHTDA